MELVIEVLKGHGEELYASGKSVTHEEIKFILNEVQENGLSANGTDYVFVNKRTELMSFSEPQGLLYVIFVKEK